ncbi:MAG: hypothetical protein WA517_01925 [Candidatus Acidiferrum sp.]
MQNPWLKLPQRPYESGYILEMDLESIKRYNDSKRSEDRKANLKSIPEPFIGNPGSARVVLLSLNPGDSENDLKDHSSDRFKKALFSNLAGELCDYPFYLLNPDFRETGAGKWWFARTRELREAGLGNETIAKRLLVIEWFPYHSRRSGFPNKSICESQSYSLHLALEMLEKKQLVVGMRSRKKWTAVDQKFAKVPFLKNPQCGHISRNNTEGDVFDRIVEALK